MQELAGFALLCFTSYFTLMNPLGLMPVFLTMTAGLNEKEKAKTARKAIIVAFGTLLAFAFTGQFLFEFFGISVDSFRIVGGVIFFIMGMEMLNARLAKMKIHEDEIKEYVTDISITPLAIPMLAGPGAITNSIILMEDAEDISHKITLIVVIAIILLTTYFVLWAGAGISKFLGETGIKIMMRLMGLIIMVIAVEFFFSGLKPILTDILSH
jgi:multiple antibiotic resistance protein